jgi:hypothetical protein
MLKKMTALLLLTAFTHVYAITPLEQSTARQNELKSSFDSLNYSLNVEWNQKDTKFFNDAVSNFESEIATLQHEGLTQQELLSYALGKAETQNAKDEINKLAKVISDSQMSPEEARAFVISKIDTTYSHGASWSGKIMGMSAGYFIATVIVVAGLVHYYRCHKGSPTTCDFLPGFPH